VSISMDFIVVFLKVDVMNNVMVVIDKFIKYVIFIVALIVCITKFIVGLFYCNVVKYFGLPSDIMSDCNV
jgi:hypothetical protein